jgi:hypothetical protein
VIVELLQADLDDLEREGVDVDEAFERGCRAAAERTIHDQPSESPETAAGLAELVDLYAEAAADMRLLRFAYARERPRYLRSRNRYDALEGALNEIRRQVAPGLRARLLALRLEEAELERGLRGHGIDPGEVGPHVEPGRAIETSPRPGEGVLGQRSLPPLPPARPGWVKRLLERRRGS